ncbi:MAG: outer membrane protein assembly factor BamD, partial [Bdellovibrionota bacterium]
MLVSRLDHLFFYLIVASAGAVMVSSCSSAPKRASNGIYAQLVQRSVRHLSSSSESESNKLEAKNGVDGDDTVEKVQEDADSLIKRADEEYEKDKESWYRRAEQDYGTFTLKFSKHPLAPRAFFRIGEIRFRFRNCSSCDLKPIHDALDAYLTIIERYSGSSYDVDARRRIRDCREIMAEHSNLIGQYHLKRDKYEAAIARFAEGLAFAREGVKTYPDK